jgi:hypothetical protein
MVDSGMGKAATIFVGLLCFAAGATAQDIDYLRLVYERSPEKKALVAQAAEHLSSFCRKADAALDPIDLVRDQDALWLTQHRVPATLAIEDTLKTAPSEAQMEALADLMRLMGGTRISRQLPPMYNSARRLSTRVKLLRAMADCGTRECVALLVEVLERADADTPDEILAPAARGVGRTRNKEYLPLLQKTSVLARSQLCTLEFLQARYLCGETELAAEIVKPLTDKNSDPQLLFAIIEFAGNNLGAEAVKPLALVGAEHPNDDIGRRAIRALLCASAYPVEQWAPLFDQFERAEVVESGGTAEAIDPELQPNLPLPIRARRKMVQAVMTWFEQNPQGRLQAASGATSEQTPPPEH